MTNIMIDKLLRKNRAMFLAYDHGIEHGPEDFNIHNVNPKRILDIALEGGYTGIILQHGVAEKYYTDAYRDIPLIIKLNGKTCIPHIDPISRQVCSVERAIKLGADAVGYTIYDGSPTEPKMFKEFSKIVEEAHDYGLPVIAWMYPRGKFVKDEKDTKILAYSARIGLELGADIVKMKYNNDPEGLKWITTCAGKTRVVISGGNKIDIPDFLHKVEEIIKSGASGIAVGRNIWQHDKPFTLTKAIQKIVFDGKSAEEAIEFLNK